MTNRGFRVTHLKDEPPPKVIVEVTGQIADGTSMEELDSLRFVVRICDRGKTWFEGHRSECRNDGLWLMLFDRKIVAIAFSSRRRASITRRFCFIAFDLPNLARRASGSYFGFAGSRPFRLVRCVRRSGRFWRQCPQSTWSRVTKRQDLKFRRGHGVESGRLMESVFEMTGMI